MEFSHWKGLVIKMKNLKSSWHTLLKSLLSLFVHRKSPHQSYVTCTLDLIRLQTMHKSHKIVDLKWTRWSNEYQKTTLCCQAFIMHYMLFCTVKLKHSSDEANLYTQLIGGLWPSQYNPDTTPNPFSVTWMSCIPVMIWMLCVAGVLCPGWSTQCWAGCLFSAGCLTTTSEKML